MNNEIKSMCKLPLQLSEGYPPLSPPIEKNQINRKVVSIKKFVGVGTYIYLSRGKIFYEVVFNIMFFKRKIFLPGVLRAEGIGNKALNF